ncbi:MAG: hypothetical protein MK033_08930 [Candidatus Caenarcaniphilales bacterium]|nr:hypothetical protein [Candidatus Caenarcaniphilales bacterium]
MATIASHIPDKSQAPWLNQAGQFLAEHNEQSEKDFIDENTFPKKEKISEQLKNNKFHLLAAAINTREPVRRTVLEVSAFDLPELAAAIITKRPKENIIEILLRSFYTSSATALNAKILTGLISNVGKLFSPKKDHNNLLHIARFHREELDDLESFKKGIARMEEEAEDQEFMAGLANGEEAKVKHLDTAEAIRNFALDFEASE